MTVPLGGARRFVIAAALRTLGGAGTTNSPFPTAQILVAAPLCARYSTNQLTTAELNVMTPDQLSSTLSALADPTRRAILARLAAGDATVGELAAPHEMSMAAVSKHLKVLEKAGLITRSREAQWRRCHLQAAPLADAWSWLSEYRRFWDRSLDGLAVHLAAMQRRDSDSSGS